MATVRTACALASGHERANAKANHMMNRAPSYHHPSLVGLRPSSATTGMMTGNCNPQIVSAKASMKEQVGRRQLLAEAAALSCSLAALSLGEEVVRAEDALSEWERVPLPVDPGVVLLDIAFVPDEPNHGFLLGTRQTLLQTKDGGYTWFPRSIPSAEDEDFNYRFNSISFKGKEGWIVGKPAILLHTFNAGESWERIPLSSQLPGDLVYIQATGEKSAEMVTDEGAIYVTSNKGYNWKAAVQETVSATLNRTVSSGISGASYYTGTFNTVNRSPEGFYVAVSSRGNFYLTWEPGQPYWQPHNRTSARRIQNMGWRADGGLWLLVRGGGLYLSRGTGITEDFDEVQIQSRGFGILDVGYRSKDEAWAAGGSGILLRTVNGGKTWTRDKAADNIAANLYTVNFDVVTEPYTKKKLSSHNRGCSHIMEKLGEACRKDDDQISLKKMMICIEDDKLKHLNS